LIKPKGVTPAVGCITVAFVTEDVLKYQIGYFGCDLDHF
jgi:hypothetical protein